MHRRPLIPDEDSAVALRLLASACHQSDGTGLSLRALHAFLRGLQSRVRLPDVGAMISAALDRVAIFQGETSLSGQRAALHALLDLSGMIARALESPVAGMSGSDA